MGDSAIFPGPDDGIDPALRPLLRWAEPLLAPSRARCLAQWRDSARQHRDALDFERLRPCIDAAFAAPALAWSSRSLLLELAIARHQRALSGATPRQRHDEFLDWIDSAAGRQALDQRYPLLGEDIVLHATQTEKVLTAFLRRYLDERALLAPLFAAGDDPGRLRGFASGLGDRHDHGGSVIQLQFERGRALYKPRSLAMDAAYARFLADLRAHGVTPDQRAALSMDRGSHGYAEWIAHSPLADDGAASRYYRRYGGLVAIAYVLGCTDLHLENLIAGGEYPVVIDLETVFQPWMNRGGQPRASGPYAPSVLFSGLLPSDRNDPDAHDTSALAWAEQRYRTRRATGAGSDELRLAPTDATTQAGANLPRHRDGRRVASHEHTQAVLDGFEETYRGLLRMKPALRDSAGPLTTFAGLDTRALLRSTHIYARLLDALSHPQYLRSAAEREQVLERLEVGSRDWPFLARTQAAERAALLRGDVPRFNIAIDGTGVHDSDGHRIEAVFGRSGRDEVRRRVRLLSARDLHRQRYALAQSLESIRPWPAIVADAATAPLVSSRADAGARIDDDADRANRRVLLDTAVALGDEVLRLAFRGRGEIAWFQPEYRNRPEPSIAPMGLTLYEGVPGTMLMLAELGVQTGQARFTRAAEAALAACRRQLREDPRALAAIGPWSGLSGWIYALLVLGLRWRRPELLDEAGAWLPHIAERIEQDRDLDLISGAAGCLLALTQLQRHRPDADTRAAAMACAAHLAAHAQGDADEAWWLCPASPERGLTGFAHGTAGIAAALARHAQLNDDGAALRLARRALRYERASFERRGRRWYDQFADLDPAAGEEPREDIHSWCHGAPGVGLARLLLPSVLRDGDWDRDLSGCVAGTRAHGLSGGDCLCHGQAGNLDLLLQHGLESSPTQGGSDAIAHCRALGAAWAGRTHPQWRCGGRSAQERPLGLMVGLSGIAYACLRLRDPAGAPSLLSLATD
ncbi:type 2 lanthipeptide synthetase LanM family protein [Lysobacter gummosus]|uniref:Type 2 lantipeptide synthetase LanM family protein n=1 Tax=Lysobacter gummosus TaxID=262324 RepID=A0ABY3XDN5_9GAMM|nr:type 2 lanthipeptide synthetase LanM family protein [Lysobacter gummosus]ALN94223.1 type 2 lantibiotic biosynthesis LanM family protein [Lysobacter gummosus]UNP29632.1 type 2 lantipeptide synthetase LanM family protein [Lysobacter gummosus]